MTGDRVPDPDRLDDYEPSPESLDVALSVGERQRYIAQADGYARRVTELEAEVDRLRDQNDGLYLAIQMASREQDQLRALLAEVKAHDERKAGPWTRWMHERVQAALQGRGKPPVHAGTEWGD